MEEDISGSSELERGGVAVEIPRVGSVPLAARLPPVNLGGEFANETLQFTREHWGAIEGAVGQTLARRKVRKGIPFKEIVLADDLPNNFRALSYEYDGTADPWEHLCRSENSALLHRYSDGVKCRVFLTTLSKFAQKWFSQLPHASIGSFGEFSSAFLHQFASSSKHQRTPLTLFNIKQGESKPLRSYIKRFTTAALEVPLATQEVLASALSQGLREGDFFRSIAKRSAKDFDDLLARAEKYINLEEAQKSKKDEGKDRKREKGEGSREINPKRYREDSRPGLLARALETRSYTPLVAPSSVLVAMANNKELKWHGNYSNIPHKPGRISFFASSIMIMDIPSRSVVILRMRQRGWCERMVANRIKRVGSRPSPDPSR
ncbi:hypothetical protein DH2020_029972 [Rehmannia glutinosa]|uniref:Retrotransposon gag domain-containing protein n=1 Tax=Rehmannia glutinosa TaxID=99300 RepID=A0ABR0VM59_REHGL